MNTSPQVPARKRGKELPLPDLRHKIELLLEAKIWRDGQARPLYAKQSAIAHDMGMAPEELSRSMAAGTLSSARFPALLRLFELEVSDWVLPQSDTERHWVRLAQEPIDAFRARVRLAGGSDHGGTAGAVWDRFLAGWRAAGRCRPNGPHSFVIDARSRDEWRSPRAPARTLRMGPPGAADLHASLTPELPTVKAGHLAKVFLDAGAALPGHNIGAHGADVFLFQDVVINRERHIAALVPYPPDSGLEMPPAHLASGDDFDPIVQVPLPRGAEQFLEIYADWGSLRSLFAVVSQRALDPEILADGRCRRQLRPERLDLLAARLGDPSLPAGSFAVWELQYHVEP